MARTFSTAFYRSTPWRKCRAGYIKMREGIDGGLCEICGDKPGFIVHHKERLTPENIDNPEVTLNWDKLQYACIGCHNAVYNPAAVGDGLMFDEEGNLIEVPPVF